MGNPQVDALANASRQDNSHSSGRFDNLVNNANQTNVTHSSQFISSPGTEMENHLAVNNLQQGDGMSLPINKGGKYFSDNPVNINTQINTGDLKPEDVYINDAKVKANLKEKRNFELAIDVKSLIIIVLILLIYIFFLPLIFDYFNQY